MESFISDLLLKTKTIFYAGMFLMHITLDSAQPVGLPLTHDGFIDRDAQLAQTRPVKAVVTVISNLLCDRYMSGLIPFYLLNILEYKDTQKKFLLV